MGQGDLPDFRPQLPAGLHGRLHRRSHLGMHAGDEIFFGDPQPQPLDGLAEGRPVIRHRLFDRGRITGVVPGDSLQQQRRIFDVLGERADLIEGRSKRHQSVAGHSTIGRFQSHHPAK